MPLQSARQAWSYLYAIKLRLLFGISKVFGAFSWWLIKIVLFGAGVNCRRTCMSCVTGRVYTSRFYFPLFNSNRYYGK